MGPAVTTSDHLGYEDRGRGAPIVFIHGLTFSKETWRPIIDRLVDRCRCVAIDLPGHGESEALPRSWGEVGEQIHRLMSDLGIERPVMVGHSYGAMFVTEYAAEMPVAGVVNVDQTLLIEPQLRMTQQIEPLLRGDSFAAVFEPIRQDIGVDWLPEPLRSATEATQTVRRDLVVRYWLELGNASPEAMQATVDELTTRITAPYLAIFGHCLPDEDRAYLEEHVRSLQLEEWQERDHMVHLMEPDRFAHRLVRFVESLR